MYAPGVTPSPLFVPSEYDAARRFLAMRDTVEAITGPSALPPIVGAPSATHTVEASGSRVRFVSVATGYSFGAWRDGDTLRATALDVDQWNAAGRPSRVRFVSAQVSPVVMVAADVARESRAVEGAPLKTLRAAVEALAGAPVVLAVENDRAASRMGAKPALSAVFDVFVIG